MPLDGAAHRYKSNPAKCTLLSKNNISKITQTFRVNFATFGVGSSISDVKGSDIGGSIFGHSGLRVHFRTFGVRTLGGPFSDVRGSFWMFGSIHDLGP